MSRAPRRQVVLRETADVGPNRPPLEELLARLKKQGRDPTSRLQLLFPDFMVSSVAVIPSSQVMSR